MIDNLKGYVKGFCILGRCFDVVFIVNFLLVLFYYFVLLNCVWKRSDKSRIMSMRKVIQVHFYALKRLLLRLLIY